MSSSEETDQTEGEAAGEQVVTADKRSGLARLNERLRSAPSVAEPAEEQLLAEVEERIEEAPGPRLAGAERLAELDRLLDEGVEREPLPGPSKPEPPESAPESAPDRVAGPPADAQPTALGAATVEGADPLRRELRSAEAKIDWLIFELKRARERARELEAEVSGTGLAARDRVRENLVRLRRDVEETTRRSSTISDRVSAAGEAAIEVAHRIDLLTSSMAELTARRDDERESLAAEARAESEAWLTEQKRSIEDAATARVEKELERTLGELEKLTAGYEELAETLRSERQRAEERLERVSIAAAEETDEAIAATEARERERAERELREALEAKTRETRELVAREREAAGASAVKELRSQLEEAQKNHSLELVLQRLELSLEKSRSTTELDELRSELSSARKRAEILERRLEEASGEPPAG